MLGNDGLNWVERLQFQIAKDLRAMEWSQSEIAEVLGTTQSTISRQYHREAPKLNGSADEILIDDLARDISEKLDRMGPGVDLVKQRIVIEFQFSDQQPILFDKTLTGKDLGEDQSNSALLKRLEWAATRIDAEKFEIAMPAVGMNIASCAPGAMEIEDVAAFPGKLSVVSGKLRQHEKPTFGSSNTLANMLLDYRDIHGDKYAIINVSPPLRGEQVDVDIISKACDEMSWKLGYAPKGELKHSTTPLDIILDEGSFGWAPSLFILSENPLDLIDKTHRLIDKMY